MTKYYSINVNTFENTPNVTNCWYYLPDGSNCLIIDVLTKLLETLSRRSALKETSGLKWTYASEYMPPFFKPKDLDNIFTVACKLREQENRDSFDENLQGFTPISSSAVVQMSDIVQIHRSVFLL